MKPNISREEKMEKIDYVMKIMGIHHRKDIIVGDSRNKVMTINRTIYISRIIISATY
jgi:hypothetical protein